MFLIVAGPPVLLAFPWEAEVEVSLLGDCWAPVEFPGRFSRVSAFLSMGGLSPSPLLVLLSVPSLGSFPVPGIVAASACVIGAMSSCCCLVGSVPRGLLLSLESRLSAGAALVAAFGCGLFVVR